MTALRKILSTQFSLSKSKWSLLLILGLGYLVIFLLQKPKYFLTDDLDFFLGVLFAPYIIRKTAVQKSYRFFFGALLLFSTLLFWRSNTFYFFAFGFSLLFFLESFFFRVNALGILL
ncbi:MAG: hypothetical protein AAF573_09120, partial [Bacteroidota bacterium]